MEKHSPKRILCFLSEMEGAGVQRVMLDIINHLDRSRFQPTLIVNRAEGPYLPLLNPDVPVIEIGASKLRYAIWGLVKRIRQVKPDIIFTALPGPSIIAALAIMISRSKAVFVTSEHNNRTAMGVSRLTFLHMATKWAFRKADFVIANSNGVRKDLNQRFGRKINTRTIYNPIDLTHVRREAKSKSGGNHWLPKDKRQTLELLAIGRLVRQKGFDLLVESLALISALPWRLTILGEGPQRQSLESLIAKHALGQRVSLPGFTSNPFSWMSEADLLILPSRWEGFGNVIVEAMACGCPVLATRCPSGPDEIITDGIDGELCEPNSATELATHISALIKDKPLRLQYRKSGLITCQNFSVRESVSNYQAVFDHLAGIQKAPKSPSG